MIKRTHNLIILDKSGSMSSIRNQAVAGVNETVGTIKKIERETGVSQTVTLVTFCSCKLDYVLQNRPVNEVGTLTNSDFVPCCCTPLYDAVGNCCSRLKSEIGNDSETAVSVTIITDGYENDSKEWNAHTVKRLIETLKADGWLFAYIGANQNLEDIKFSMAIDNCLDFEATEEGTAEMFKKDAKARLGWADKIAKCCCASEIVNCKYFDEDDE